MRQPFVVGLTGSIGCGKSSVMQTLVSLGADGIDADQVSHDVTAPDGPGYAAVVAEFGAEVLASDGQIDRRQLGRRVFADPAALARLEQIVHPAVAEGVRARIAASSAPLVVLEAIKLLEAGLSRALCDEVWVVACSPEDQLARLAASRGMPADAVARRRAAQMSQEAMIAQAQRVIDTSGTLSRTRIRTLAEWLRLGRPLPPVQVRPATVADAEGVAEVLNTVIREGGLTVLDRIMSADEEAGFLRSLPPRAGVMLALIGNVVAGFQCIEPYAHDMHAIDHVATLGTYVLPAVRQRGVGHALSAATFDDARQASFSKLVISVRADNQGAQAFYARLGFQPCGRLARQAFIDNGYVDVLLYELFLN